MDLKKAFDTIDHEILLLKLDHDGFRGSSNRYIASYLRERKQYLVVGGTESEKKSILKGVPQGSILGPFLFCLYINDIVKAVEAEVVLFADDAAFILVAPSIELLYQKIRKLFEDLSKYLIANKLVPNLRKSKLMLFTSRPPPNILENMKFFDENIEWISEIKYLGLTLSNKMSFSSHIDNVVTKISRYMGVFSQLSKIIPLSILRLLYFSFIVPHLSLHIVVWGVSPEYLLDRLAIKQNGLLRIILKVPFDNGRPVVATSEMYRELDVLTLRNIYKIEMFKFMHLVLNGKLPVFYNLLLRPLISTHNHYTRGGDFRHPLVRCEIIRRSVVHQLILMYELVDPDLYNNISTGKAAFRYKKHLLSSQ